MSAVKAKLALLSTDENLSGQLAEHSPVLLSADDLNKNTYDIDILIFDSALKLSSSDLELLTTKKNREFQRVIFLLKKNEALDLKLLSRLQSHYYVYSDELNSEYLHQQWQEITQHEQDETYLSLSTELNQQYELLKTELENRLSEKSKNLIESRKQIFEINNRVEVLRKSLYATSEVKNLTEAERVLNDLLVSFGLITWLKIIKPNEVNQFESDLKAHLDSNFYSSKININSQDFYVYFFKGDRRAFKKPDLNFFNKLTEALQINLNRYNNLLALQQSERLFDLAFHSSPHPIIVIDSDYHVFQANLAAEQKADDSKDNLKCHELLFGRSKPCVGCHLGSKFEIQHDVKTYAVQSGKFNNLVDSSKVYWIHLYEDVSEQRALESKFQQTARLSELGLISSSIAHELNNPLGGILSYLQIMKMELPAQHPFLADIAFLTEAANRMKKHIEDLLLFSRKDESIKLEKVDLAEVLQKNLDLLQMQLKKEHLIVSFQTVEVEIPQQVSILHFRNSIHLVFQFLLYKLKLKRQNKSNFSGLVEVKISQDQINSYLSFSGNLGPHDLQLNTNDLSLISLEKSILDQGFQLVISEPQPLWMQLLITMPL